MPPDPLAWVGQVGQPQGQLKPSTYKRTRERERALRQKSEGAL